MARALPSSAKGPGHAAMRIPLAALTLALCLTAACSSGREAASCTGPAFALNAGLWTPAPGELPR